MTGDTCDTSVKLRFWMIAQHQIDSHEIPNEREAISELGPRVAQGTQ